jgi:hypothetical protein
MAALNVAGMCFHSHSNNILSGLTHGQFPGNPITSGKRPAGTVLLEEPIKRFRIPTVKAECIMDESIDLVTYCAPEEIDIIDAETGQKYQTCRIPVMMSGVLRGFVPLPRRYEGVWLELAYNIVMFRCTWKFWAEEERKARRRQHRDNAATLRRTTGTQLAQHMLARLIAVRELVSWEHDTEKSGYERVRTLDEWKIRSSRDMFNIPYDKVPVADRKFLAADPIRAENLALFGKFVNCGDAFTTLINIYIYVCVYVEGDWNLDEEGKRMLSPPEDLAEWIHGELEEFEETFNTIIKPQALKDLKSSGIYRQTQYEQGARLPTQWHEGHEPHPYFWSVKQWNWTAAGERLDIVLFHPSLDNVNLAGNDVWHKPIDFLYYVLKEDPPYTQFEEFTQDLDALFNMVVIEPALPKIHGLAHQLWYGERTWREFVKALLDNHLQIRGAVTTTSEQRGI